MEAVIESVTFATAGGSLLILPSISFTDINGILPSNDLIIMNNGGALGWHVINKTNLQYPSFHEQEMIHKTLFKKFF